MSSKIKFDTEKIRDDFPILRENIKGHPLVYLDNAATTQKPQQVLDCITKFYQENYANVHRGTHTLTDNATFLFEQARNKAHLFINAKHAQECIFVRGATEGINLVANGFSRAILKPGDEIIISQIEHHSNIVPWQIACQYTGAKLKVIPCNAKGELLISEYEKLLNPRTKIVSLAHVSNALGTINPIAQMIRMAHQNGTPILIDGAQAAPHLKIDVEELDCDFYVFSGHKMYGPTGIGILYGKSEWLDKLPPYQAGGEMIQKVTFAKTIYNKLPYKFEAETPAIAQAIGLGAAIDYLQAIDLGAIAKYENTLLQYALEKMRTIPDLKFIGSAEAKSPIISFLLTNIHPHDIGTVLNENGIAVRTGQLCAEPALAFFGVKALVRASFGIYNTISEIDILVETLAATQQLFNR